MTQSNAWEEIEALYSLKHIEPATITQFRQLKQSQNSHTKGEGNPHHYCSFFLPYDRTRGKIYLCHHKKADDWIPPGGHIEPGETPTQAAIREMYEELRQDITLSQLEPWNLSVKVINRPAANCLTHYDIWHLVHLKVQDFDYDPKEYHDAAWFGIEAGAQKITKNPDFARIIQQLANIAK